MRAVVVYESMYGNTHLVADAIGEGLAPVGEVVVVPVDQATPEVVASADLVVVGGPTHAHGMSRASTRASAVEQAGTRSTLDLDAAAEGSGLRDWFADLGALDVPAAAFDTRMTGPAWVTGQASKGIAKRLRRAGCRLLAQPASFIVTKENQLADREEANARRFGSHLAEAVGGPIRPQAAEVSTNGDGSATV